MKLTKEGWAVIEGDTYLSNDIITQGRLDVAKDFLEQFRQYIPVGGTVVDVGASLGDYTATFADMVMINGSVFAFEPNPPVFECLNHNMYGIKDRPNVFISDFGLGASTKGVGTIIFDANNVGASRIEPLAEGEIFMTTLNEMFLVRQRLRRLDFLKIDAEGWEPLILDGGRETINRFRPAMLIEVNTWPLGKMGFTAEDLFLRIEALDYTCPRFDGPYGDILCLPKEKA